MVCVLLKVIKLYFGKLFLMLRKLNLLQDTNSLKKGLKINTKVIIEYSKSTLNI